MQRKSAIKMGIVVIITGVILLKFASDFLNAPMNILGSDSQSSKFTEAYWGNIAKTNQPLFSKAMDYCSANPDKPNCDAVRGANFDKGDEQK